MSNYYYMIFSTHNIISLLFYSDLRKLERDFKEFPAQKIVDNCLDCGSFANQRLLRSGRWSLERLTTLVVFSYYLCIALTAT